MTPQKKYTEYLKCDFSDAEIAEAAKELARANQRRSSIEQQKKEVDSQLKAEIEAQNTSINRLSGLIATGSEYRNVDCRIELDAPEKGRKRVVRLDTNEEVRVVAMTDEDKQMSLELDAKFAEAEARQEQEAIVPVPPQILQIETSEGPVTAEITNGPTLSPATLAGGTHQKREKRRRNPEAEAFVDGSAADTVEAGPVA